MTTASHSPTTSPIQALAAEFAQELSKFQARCATSNSTSTLALSISLSYGKIKFQLRFTHGYDLVVKGSDLGAVLDEAYHRAGFDDHQAGAAQAISAALLGLPSPGQDEPEELPPPEPLSF